MNEIDATGLTCPMPVLRLQRKLRAVDKGTQLTLLASDPMAAIDVPHFCSQGGHKLIAQSQEKGGAPGGADLLVFKIEKR